MTRRAEILENPRVWVAQPTLSISTTLTVTNDGISARHVDLRPFVLQSSGNGVRLVGFVITGRIVGCELFTGWWIKRFLGCADEAHD